MKTSKSREQIKLEMCKNVVNFSVVSSDAFTIDKASKTVYGFIHHSEKVKLKSRNAHFKTIKHYFNSLHRLEWQKHFVFVAKTIHNNDEFINERVKCEEKGTEKKCVKCHTRIKHSNI